jgi:aconitate hydratase
MLLVAKVLKGKKVSSGTSLVISPGSRQVFSMLSKTGALSDIISSGARILECACGPCIGMGQAPSSGAVTLRTFNRNFEGRSGTKDAKVYLCSPETAAAAALKGEITDPRRLGKKPKVTIPAKLDIDMKLFLKPSNNPGKETITRGPNIKPLPEFEPLKDSVTGKVILKVEDNITTDHILPAGAKILPLRSNLPAISEYTFSRVDREFAKNAKNAKSGFIVGGDNYGQGSSREHAALAPRYLGIKAVIAKSFARIHLANLINFGILPLTFKNPEDYSLVSRADQLELSDLQSCLKDRSEITASLTNSGRKIPLTFFLTQRQREIILAGGLLNYIKNKK